MEKSNQTKARTMQPSTFKLTPKEEKHMYETENKGKGNSSYPANGFGIKCLLQVYVFEQLTPSGEFCFRKL